jgi:hypothetical protein
VNKQLSNNFLGQNEQEFSGTIKSDRGSPQSLEQTRAAQMQRNCFTSS